MAILYEYNEDENWYAGCYDANGNTFWNAQVFTPSTAHTIISVQLKLYRTGSPGTFDVGIYAVDGDGHPDINSGALCSGSIQGNDLETGVDGADPTGAWTEITLGDGTILAAYKKYAIVCNITGGDINNRVNIRYHDAGSYTGGYREFSQDGGDSWIKSAAVDITFREYGINAQYSPLILTPGKIGMWGW